MYRATISFLQILLLTTICLGQSNRTGFTIIGNTTGFKDSTLLYLDDVTDGSFKHLDSTLIKEGRFVFKGSLKTKFLKAYIRTEDFEDRVPLWLENAVIYINGEKGNFRQSVIKGSKIQAEQDKLQAILMASDNSARDEYLYVRNNPGSIISASMLNTYCATWGKDTAAKLYTAFTNELKNSFYGKQISRFILLNKNLKIGNRYADFTEKDVNGKAVSVSDFYGKVILLEFWGSWCGPCREKNPELVKIYNEFKTVGFDILGVAAETNREQWLEAVAADKLPWTNITDFKGGKNKAALIYGVTGYPSNFLIDRKGIVVARDLSIEALRKKLGEML